MHDIRPYLEALASAAHPEGGWGYAPGQAVHLEPTCLALLAVSLEPHLFKSVIERGFAVLNKSSTPDGAFCLANDRAEAIWPTALVLFLQAFAEMPRQEVERTATRALRWQGRNVDDKEAAHVHDFNLELVGWPWALNNFPWVEPTAWACLALRRAGYGSHPRVEEGLRLLLDRAFDDGGINYGNRTVLGRRTEPIPGPTALMLLALQGHGHEPRVAAAVNYLLRQAAESDDLEHLCWAKLALDCHRPQLKSPEALTTLDDRIQAAYERQSTRRWIRPATLRISLAALALASEEKNVFRLSAEVRSSTQYSVPSTPYSALSTQHSVLSTRHSRASRWSNRLASAFRGLAIQAVTHLRQMAPQTAVHIARADDYNGDLADILQRQYEYFRQRVPLNGKRVVLKPNLVEYHRDKVINTHPHVVAAAIELCRREGAAEIIVAEGPGHWRNVEYLAEASGLADVVRHYDVSFTDLNHDEPVKMPNLGRLTRLDYLYLSRTVASADVLISLPKLKTHHWAGATLSLKNLFGTLPGICYGWPKNELHWRGIDNSIVDIALTRTPDLAIVDGIIGMEGDGPLNGVAKPLGALIMGCDPLAVDATCCRLMHLNPARIGSLILGYRNKLGLMQLHEIRQIGENIEALAQCFQTVPHFQELRLARPA